VLSLLATTAAAQEDAGPDSALTIAKLYVKSKELPEGCRFAPGMPCATHHMEALYSARSMKALAKGVELPPEAEALFPVPKAKEWQSFEAEGGVAGSVFMFEYSEEDLEKARDFFPSFLYGQDGGSSVEHPEEIILQDRLVIILSFPRGDPAAEWYKQRLRTKFKVPAVREHLEVRELGYQLVKALGEEDIEGGLALLDTHSADVADWAFGQFLLGTFAIASKDPERAVKAYRRALELHDTLEDPLKPGLVVPALIALGLALLQEDKPKDAVPVLQRAEEHATKTSPEQAAGLAYNLACAFALLERWPESLDALKRAIRDDPEYKKMARTDEDLAEARKRKEFEKLLN